MSLTTQDREWFDKRTEELGEAHDGIVEDIVEEVRSMMLGRGLHPANDDSAAAFEGAVARYIIESRKPFSPAPSPAHPPASAWIDRRSAGPTDRDELAEDKPFTGPA
jgi:hypothetical protein